MSLRSSILRNLDFIESSGLGDIIAAYQKCRNRGAELRLVGPAPSIMRVLEITRLDQLFRICDTLESALAPRKFTRYPKQPAINNRPSALGRNPDLNTR